LEKNKTKKTKSLKRKTVKNTATETKNNIINSTIQIAKNQSDNLQD